MSKRKTSRNRRIYELHDKKGLSTYVLARRFHISPPAIFKIIHRERKELEIEGGRSREAKYTT